MENLRKEKRIPIRITLKFSGRTDKGFTLNSEIVSENISKSGICFRTKSPMAVNPGDIITGILEHPQFKTDWEFIVIWKQGNLMGCKLQKIPDHWFIR